MAPHRGGLEDDARCFFWMETIIDTYLYIYTQISIRCISKICKYLYICTPTVYPSQSQFTNHFVLPNLPERKNKFRCAVWICLANILCLTMQQQLQKLWRHRHGNGITNHLPKVFFRGKFLVKKTREGSLEKFHLKTLGFCCMSNS